VTPAAATPALGAGLRSRSKSRNAGLRDGVRRSEANSTRASGRAVSHPFASLRVPAAAPLPHTACSSEHKPRAPNGPY
jgi:hypothetical protein